MKRFLTGIASITAALMISTGAEAYVPDGTRIDPTLVRQLMGWVEAQTGVAIPNLPNVIASRQKFNMVMNFAGVHYADAKSLYIPGTVIMDNEDWDASDPAQVSLLVHELVHHAQLFSKRRYPCPDAREYEAYSVQNRWLASRGEEPFASQDWISQMSSCGGNSLGIS